MYKRQVLFSSRAGIGNTAILVKEGATNQGFQSIIPHKGKLDTYFIFSRTRELKKYGETNGAVSYTHLKVFKGLERSMTQHPLQKWIRTAGIERNITCLLYTS